MIQVEIIIILRLSGITKSQIVYGHLVQVRHLMLVIQDIRYIQILRYKYHILILTLLVVLCHLDIQKMHDIPGDPLNHNGANSFLMPVAGTIDRSNTTTCTRLAQENNNPFYYLVAYKLGIHAVEATNRNIASFFHDDFRGQNYFKRNGRVITDWVHYPTNKTGSDYNTVIAWTGENMNFAFGSGDFLSIAMDSIYNAYVKV